MLIKLNYYDIIKIYRREGCHLITFRTFLGVISAIGFGTSSIILYGKYDALKSNYQDFAIKYSNLKSSSQGIKEIVEKLKPESEYRKKLKANISGINESITKINNNQGALLWTGIKTGVQNEVSWGQYLSDAKAIVSCTNLISNWCNSTAALCDALYKTFDVLFIKGIKNDI